MKYILRNIIMLAAITLPMFSCVKDNVTGDSGEGMPVTLTLGTRGVGSVQYHEDDYALGSLRIMGYRTSTGTLAFNKLIKPSEFTVTGSGDEVKRQARVEVITGDFTIVFVGNEASDAAAAAALADETRIYTLTNLKKLTFDYTAFDADENIPMLACYDNVQVLGDNSLNVAGSPVTGVWPIKLDRLAVMLDITLTLTPKQFLAWDAVTGGKKNMLTVAGMPQEVPLFKETDNSATRTDRDYAAAAGSAGYPNQPGIIEGPDLVTGNYTVSFPRIIVPELWFAEKNDAAKAAKIRVYTREGGTDVSYEGKIGYETTDDTNYDYRLPRNHYFDIKSRIDADAELGISIEVKDWENGDVDDMEGDRELRVSVVDVSINEHNAARVYFWTNRKEVSLYDKTSARQDMDDLFYGLTGGGENFHFDSSTGEGWFDIVTDRQKPGVTVGGTYTHGIVLDAGGHKREITVNVDIPSSDFGKYDYVGAFWRNNQTGERVIAMANTGPWTATVDGSPGWVVLAPGKSFDLNLYVEGKEPDDAENYQVEGGSTTVSGTGNIYFRIGLTGPNHTGKNRYAKVTVNGTKAIYIRQGEDPDYLMRPEDETSNGSLTAADGIYRPLAAKFTAYNLSSKEYVDGIKNGGSIPADHSQLTVRGGVFTEYPSQAGGLFQWANPTYPRYAWHPTESFGAITGWSSSIETGGWSNLRDDHETCPVGYRRPFESTSATISAAAPADSEIKQSLFLTPGSGTNANLGNTSWGYLADGFFDRRFIENSQYENMFQSTTNTVVCGRDYRAAYCGHLLFNPSTNASVFMPIAGSRNETYGHAEGMGAFGYYWTATKRNAQEGWMLVIGETLVNMQPLHAGEAQPIRCVVYEDEQIPIQYRFAKSNVVMKADGTLGFATTQAENTLLHANYQGLMFKWGSLIGISSDHALNTDPGDFDPSHIRFVPEGYTGEALTGYDRIPRYRSWANKPDIFLATYPNSNGVDLPAGVGDICRYISQQNWVAGNWRMPTRIEYEQLARESSFINATGLWTGSVIINGATWGTAGLPIGKWVGSQSTTYLTAPPEETQFFPAGGYRDEGTGQPQLHGQEGFYWTSTGLAISVPTLIHGMYFRVADSFFTPKVEDHHGDAAAPVRCIRDN